MCQRVQSLVSTLKQKWKGAFTIFYKNTSLSGGKYTRDTKIHAHENTVQAYNFPASAFNCIWKSLFPKQKKPWGECFMFHCVLIKFHHSIWKRHRSQWCQGSASFLLVYLLRYSISQLVLAIHKYSPASHYDTFTWYFFSGDLKFFKQKINFAAERTLCTRYRVRLMCCSKSEVNI